MLTEDSPFLNIPTALNRKQAVFFDGIRLSAQIIDLTYTRLCKSLTQLSVSETPGADSAGFTHIFIDAWAFIDTVDRFRSLWEMQPSASTIKGQFSPDAVRIKLENIRSMRNISAHLAQKIDQIVSLNSSVLGAISWLSVHSQAPLKVKTHFIRPGTAHGTVKSQLAMPPIGEFTFSHGSGSISISSGQHEANLSSAYETIRSIVKFSEATLALAFQSFSLDQRLATDVFGSAELNTSGI